MILFSLSYIQQKTQNSLNPASSPPNDEYKFLILPLASVDIGIANVIIVMATNQKGFYAPLFWFVFYVWSEGKQNAQLELMLHLLNWVCFQVLGLGVKSCSVNSVVILVNPGERGRKLIYIPTGAIFIIPFSLTMSHTLITLCMNVSTFSSVCHFLTQNPHLYCPF